MSPLEAIYSFGRRDETDAAVVVRIADMDDSEAREELAKAVRILRRYPTGQDDGSWRQHRQWFLENYLPEEQCT